MERLSVKIILAISTFLIGVVFYTALKEIFGSGWISTFANVIPITLIILLFSKKLKSIQVLSALLFLIALLLFLVGGNTNPPAELANSKSAVQGYEKGYTIGTILAAVLFWTPISFGISYMVWKTKLNKKQGYLPLLTSGILLIVSLILLLG